MIWFRHYKTEVEQVLKEVIAKKKNLDVPEALLHEALSYGLLGEGKRIRPILAMLCYEACSDEVIFPREEIWKVLVSVEMIHAYSLIHDDLPDMDNDELRRGQPTVWKKYDTCAAILVGDALNTHAFENLATYAPDYALKDLILVLSQGAGMEGMLGGQMRDMYYETREFTFEQLVETHRKKTGKLIVASGLIGGILVKASSKQIDLIREYGEKIGLAFQVKDDLLDREGNSKIVGKALGKDREKGCIELLGVEKSKEFLSDLIEEASEIAVQLGSDRLGELARYIADRKK